MVPLAAALFRKNRNPSLRKSGIQRKLLPIFLEFWFEVVVAVESAKELRCPRPAPARLFNLGAVTVDGEFTVKRVLWECTHQTKVIP